MLISSSSHTYNRKSNFLVLGEGTTDGINGSTSAVEKNSINFSKAMPKFCLSLPYDGDESYFHVNKTEICKFKSNDNTSWYNFCLGRVSKDFTKDVQSKLSLNATVYEFSVDHSSIKKEDILNFHEYLIVEDNIKKCSCLLKKIFLDY